MPCIRYIFVCEGESEWAYLQRLNSFFEKQSTASGAFEPPLILIGPALAVAKTGTYGKLVSQYKETRSGNRKVSIKIWADFDLYHRNDMHCADRYLGKPSGIPDFLFSFHNFEDFYALHWGRERLEQWLHFGRQGHFATPLHSESHLPEIQRIFPDYAKGKLPVDFITWDSLKNLKSNLTHQPSSNPRGLKDVQSFAAFLIDAIERAFPNALK